MEPVFRLNHLLERRLLIISGKGGVGKTTLSLALGFLAAERGKKTIIAEVNSEEQIAHLLERPPIGYSERELLPNLWGMNIEPHQSFQEYVLLQIKFRSLYKAVFENKYVRHFIDATPGLADLMCIGKVYDLTRRYDLVILDAPATGHGIALLEIPSIVSSAVRVGPLKTDADKIESLLHDPEATQALLVTLPEEMPVSEALEMNQALTEKLRLPLGPVFLNQHQEVALTASEKKELRLYLNGKEGRSSAARFCRMIRLLLSRNAHSEEYLLKLREEIPERPVLPLPFVFSPHFGLSEIQTLAGTLEKRSA